MTLKGNTATGTVVFRL